MSHFIVRTAAACMPSSCLGSYGRVAILECEDWQNEPKMISARARGVIRVVKTWERRHWGTTERCAFRRALIEAQELCAELNKKSQKNS